MKETNWWIWERPSTINLIYIASVGAQHPLKVWHGESYAKTLYGIFRNGMVKFFCDFDNLIVNGKRIMPDFINEESYARKREKWEELSQVMYKEFDKLDTINLKETNNSEFLELYSDYTKKLLDWWGYTQVAELIGYSGEEILKENLTEEQNKKYFNVLVSPTKKSYTNKEEEELLKIVKLSKEKGLNSEEVNSAVKKHQQKYYWMQNNFYDTFVLEKQSFLDKIKKHLKDNIKVDNFIEENNQRLKSIEQKKQEIIEELRLSAELKRIVRLLDDFCLLQDSRKLIALRSNHYLELFCKEVSRRSNISYTILRWATPEQMIEIIQGKDLTLELKKQGEHSFVILPDHTNEIQVYLGLEAIQKEKELLGEEINMDEINEIEGSAANTGRVTGKVRKLLTSREIENMQDGEILVSTMTSPDFVPAMKKASAIITDEGGITSHAAIISRELGIPCVIGTKIATSVLKTGDLVEVRANHGLIKIIERAK